MENLSLKDRPLVFTMRHRGQTVIARCDSLAKQHRIAPMMTLPFAQLLAPSLLAIPFQPEETIYQLRQLCEDLSFVSPRIGLDNDLQIAARTQQLYEHDVRFSGLVIDLEGTHHLHGSALSLANTISSCCIKRGINCLLAYGPTIGVAWANSRYGQHPVTLYDPTRRQVLPIEALRISLKEAEALHQCGIHSIQECLSYTRDDIQLRFGATIAERCDLYTGKRIEAITLESEPLSFTEDVEIEPPLFSLSAIEKKTLQISSCLLRRVENLGCLARAFTLRIECLNERQKKHTIHKNFSFHRSSYSRRQLQELLQSVISSTPFPGAVERITVQAEHIEPQEQHQTHISEGRHAKRTDSITQDMYINELINHLGAPSVQSLHIESRILPEHQKTMLPLSKEYRRKKTPSAHLPIEERPGYLFDVPERIQATALLPDRPPQRIEWRKKQLRILRAHGPERLQTEWWHTQKLEQRDYFSVQDDCGRWLWIYRCLPSQEWFVHGVWT